MKLRFKIKRSAWMEGLLHREQLWKDGYRWHYTDLKGLCLKTDRRDGLDDTVFLKHKDKRREGWNAYVQHVRNLEEYYGE